MIFSRPTQDQALALAAVFQACELVAAMAHNGEVEPDQLEMSMTALLNQNPQSLEELYGPSSNLAVGIKSMTGFMTKQPHSTHQAEVVRYAISVLYLARKLSANNAMLSKIARGIEDAARQAEHFSSIHENVFANVASLYQSTVSTMRLRVQIGGSGIYLQQPAIAERIRCLLFVAIRAAFLWQQLGGTRTHLMFHRNTLVNLLPKV